MDPDVVANLTVDIGGEQVPIFYAEGADNVYSGHRNMLVYHMYEQGITNPMELFQMVYGAPLQSVLNDAALKSHRGLMMGSALMTDLQVGLGNTILQSTVVGAVEVIGARDATDSLQEQITAFFEDPGIKNALTHFYKKSMEASGDVTNSWRNGLQRPNLSLSQGGPYADASDTAPFTSEQNLAGIGMPWSLSIGRDPSGFEKFKKRETHGRIGSHKQAGFESRGIAQKRVSQYSEPLMVLPAAPGTKAEGVRVDPEVYARDPSKYRVETIRGEEVYLAEKGRELAYDPRTRYITNTSTSNLKDSARSQPLIFEGEVGSLEEEFHRSRMGSMG